MQGAAAVTTPIAYECLVNHNFGGWGGGFQQLHFLIVL
jgi:hypothetical protein